MKTFLPSGYSFSIDKLKDKQDYQLITNSNKCRIYAVALVICIIALFLTFALALYFYERSMKLWMPMFILMSISVLGCAICVVGVNRHTTNSRISAYRNSTFKLHDQSNLYITSANDKVPKNLNDSKQYSYNVYVHVTSSSDTRDTIIALCREGNSTDGNVHLGTMKNGDFTPNNNNFAAVFYQYYTYILKHNLSKKFATNVFFIRSGKYLSNNSSAQWILTNKKDTVLYLTNDYHVERSKY